MAPARSNRKTVTTIDEGADVITLINVFTVEPQKQQELVELLERATQETMRGLPGFVSANIHRSLDGRRVANYAQWRSQADFEAMLKNPQAQEHMRRSVEISRAEPVLYEVASVHR